MTIAVRERLGRVRHLAILRAEDDASDTAVAMERARIRKISAASYWRPPPSSTPAATPSPASAFDELVNTGVMAAGGHRYVYCGLLAR